MTINYKGIELNAPGDPAPWATIEQDVHKQTIDSIVIDTVSGSASDAKVNGHKHFRLYAESTGDLVLSIDNTQKTTLVGDVQIDGDIQASQVEHLRQEVTAVLTLATPDDEVVVRLESGGGMVHSYGLGASQLKRVRDRGIPLTVCIDKVAASGGYMMASIADRIVAAPFAIVGSIGVVAQLPNFHRLLKKHDVDYELFTAGKYKRTVTMFGENTEEAREKFQTDLEDTHVLFKNHVKQFRPRIDIEEVANGDIWYGQQALDKRLIDEVGTSDDYLMAACERADVYQVRYEFRKTLQEKLGVAVERGAEGAFTRLLTMLTRQQQNKG